MLIPDFDKLFISSDSLIKDAIESIDRSHSKFAIAITDTNILVGTLSDGDIRRGILKGLTINDSIHSLVARNCIVALAGMNQQSVLELMNLNKIDHIPVINSNREVIGCHSRANNDYLTTQENHMIIMAGGFGVRLKPYTDKCPKPLLPVMGKPMLQHIIERAQSFGFINITLAIGYMGNMIEDFFGDGSNFGVKISYLKEEKPLGTAGALSLIPEIPKRPFLVTNCDVLSSINYKDILNYHIANRAGATMAIKNHEIQNPFGVVITNDNQIIGFEEKPVYQSLINAGVYVLDPSVLKFLNRNEVMQMPDLFKILNKHDELTLAYLVHESWKDIGSLEELEKANVKF